MFLSARRCAEPRLSYANSKSRSHFKVMGFCGRGWGGGGYGCLSDCCLVLFIMPRFTFSPFQVGSDRSYNLAEICKDRKFEVFVGDVLSIPLRADTFDVCLCIAVIHHLATEVG